MYCYNKVDFVAKTKAKLLRNRIITTDGCWIWTGCLSKDDYGVTCFKGAQYRVHRLAMLLFKPKEYVSSLDVLHKCNGTRCFNPDHLYCGTHSDNMQDRINSGHNPKLNITHCPKGHAYTSENTYHNPGKINSRECRTCMREKSRLNYNLQSLRGLFK
jgi:hypothetical protein